MAYDQFNVDFKPTESPIAGERQKFNDINLGFSNTIANQTTVPQLVGKYNEQFGVPQMQQQIAQGTELYDTIGNQIRGLPKDVAQRSQESILTQGQKNRMVQSEQAPLLEQQGLLGQNLTRLGQNLGVAQSNASQMITAEQAQQTKELEPWLKQYDTENVLSSMAMTGWTQQNSMELQRLLANQQAGITLSEGEKNRLHLLAIQEKDFQNNLKLQQEKNKAPDLMSVGEGSTVFDPKTGKALYTAPKTYKPEDGGGVDLSGLSDMLNKLRGAPNASTNKGPINTNTGW